MPLSDDTSRAGTERNMHELKAAGYKGKQLVAIALSHRREALKKKRKRG